jgi:ribosomal protein S18 acetylase RimI-like enzyme
MKSPELRAEPGDHPRTVLPGNETEEPSLRSAMITAEIAEVYVRPEYRKQRIASRMILFAEEYCRKNYPLHKFELLTGEENLIAQRVYDKLGYKNDHELHLSKRVEKQRYIEVQDGLQSR